MPLNPDLLVKSGLSEFIRNIKMGKFGRSYDVAQRTVVILKNLVESNHGPTARDLLVTMKDVCSYIDRLGLVETVVGNMTRRIMRIIRDECQNFCAIQRANQEETLESNRDEMSDTYLNLSMKDSDVKKNILEATEELIIELEQSSKSIAQQATDYVQSDDIILTLGKSKVIESFLKHAAKGCERTGKRKFNVVVVELAPFYSGREMARSLIKSGISTLIIPDSAVFAIMSRVNKVIISTHSMMANGGIKAPAGSHSIALAAKHFSVPLIVCCPMYKLTPSYLVSHDSDAFKQFSHLHAAFPEPYTPKSQSKNSGGDPQHPPEARSLDGQPAAVEALHSTFDYVPPELITLFVSNIGGNSPSYVYQLLNELYYKLDYLE